MRIIIFFFRFQVSVTSNLAAQPQGRKYQLLTETTDTATIPLRLGVFRRVSTHVKGAIYINMQPSVCPRLAWLPLDGFS